jgi:hypothetical protein
MTDAELQGIAMQALNMAKKAAEREEAFAGLLASYHSGAPLYRMKSIEDLIASKLGRGWLNSGSAKDIAFQLIREAVNAFPPEAMVWGTKINLFTPTDKLKQMGKEASLRLFRQGHDAHHEGVREGLLRMSDALMVVAQTPSRVCMCHQECDTTSFVGQPQIHFTDQSCFDGRTKFYGESKTDFGSELGTAKFKHEA